MTKRTIDPFYVMEVVAQADARERQGNAVFHLEVGQPSTGAPRGAIDVAHHLLDTEVLGYTVSRGIAELRPAISDHIARWYNIDVSPDRVAVTQGATGAIVLAMLAAFEEGDRIAITNPGYPCYRNIAVGLHFEPVLIDVDETTRFQPTVAHLEAAHADAALSGVLIASPSNPTGTVDRKPVLRRANSNQQL